MQRVDRLTSTLTDDSSREIFAHNLVPVTAWEPVVWRLTEAGEGQRTDGRWQAMASRWQALHAK